MYTYKERPVKQIPTNYLVVETRGENIHAASQKATYD